MRHDGSGCLWSFGALLVTLLAIPVVIGVGDVIGHFACWQLGWSESFGASCPRFECGWFRICK
jgi:hypothetical protein